MPSAKEAEFDEFWTLYPRKEGKPSAQRAYRTARKKDAAARILHGLTMCLPAYAARDRSHVPMPATWLNDERWRNAPPPVPSRVNGRAPGGVQQTVNLGRRMMEKMEAEQQAVGGQ